MTIINILQEAAVYGVVIFFIVYGVKLIMQNNPELFKKLVNVLKPKVRHDKTLLNSHSTIDTNTKTLKQLRGERGF